MRIIYSLATLALVACGPGRTTFARYPGSAPTFDRAAADQKALAIADKAIAAAGGAEHWNAAKQLRWSQVVMQDGKQIVAGEQAWDRWNGRHYARAKRTDSGDIVVMRPIYENGGQALMDDGQKMRKLENGAEESIAAARERWEFDTAVLFMPFLLEEPGTKIVYDGEVTSDDGKPEDALLVTFDPKDLRKSTYRVVVNRETNLIDRIEIQKPGTGSTERLGYALTDWHEGGGIKYPGKLQNIGYQGEVLTFSDLTAGGVEDELYIPPL
jgi:hypothetical protein